MKKIAILILLLFIVSMVSGTAQSNKDQQGMVISETQSQVKETDFLALAQDDGANAFKAMDDVYYVLGSIHDFQIFSEPRFTDQVKKLTEEGVRFLNASYKDGHWANWKGSRPSMESTFQAINLLNETGFPSWFDHHEAQKVIDFLNTLKTPEGGFFPLQNWDAPDLTSTFRAIQISKTLEHHFGSFERSLNISDVTDYIMGNYIEPTFITSGSGYSEVTGGQPELLASYYALSALILLNETDPHIENVIKFIDTLSSPNGGVAGYIGGLPRTGFTARAIEYYLQVNRHFEDFLPAFPQNFLENAINFILGNQEPNSGFLSSTNDRTPNRESTFFSIRIFTELKEANLFNREVDLSGSFEFMLFPAPPSFGFGDYPSDTPNLVHTTQALLSGKLMGNSSWIDDQVIDFITESFSSNEGGFGVTPGSSPRVKYTYYGILALRSFGNPITNFDEMVSFFESSEVETGGFGQRPGAKLAYITHTYWAIAGLRMLGALEKTQINTTALIRFILSRADPNTGFFRNSLFSEPSIISTFRAVQILKWFGINVNETQILQNLPSYMSFEGGYVNTLDKTVPTMEATYYAVALQKLLNSTIDWATIIPFVNRLKNEDGGYGLREGFTSRVSSTLFGIRLMQEINEQTIATSVNEGQFPDIFAPLIEQSFLPELDNYKKFSGAYVVKANIVEPETGVKDQYVELNWYSRNGNESQVINGVRENENLFSYKLGTFEEEGLVEFRFVAVDQTGNRAQTDWFYLVSVGISEGRSASKEKLLDLGIKAIPFLMAIIGMTDAISKYNKSKHSKEEIKQMYSKKSTQGWSDLEIFNTFLVLMIMVAIAAVGRLFIFEASFVLERSIFLFRFLLAILLILFTKYSLGLETYGLFAPSVLVISMIQIGPFWGTVLFLNIFTLLYLVRTLISPYGFPVGFRIGILMVFNITYLGVMELLGEIYRIPFLSSALFIPIIILPWITDRYVGNVEQNDHFMAFSRLLASLVVTWGAYFLMSNDAWVRFVALTPEIWVLLVGTILFYGRGRKYTLIDTRRFTRLFRRGEEPLSILIRNRNFIAKYNPPEVFPLINKFDMKLQFEKWNVPTPDLYAIITKLQEIPDIMTRIKEEAIFQKGFVIKPTQSLGGMGIIVMQERDENGNFVIGGQKYAPEAIAREIQRIIQGEYLSTQTLAENDICIIEEKIIVDPMLSSISTGLPDIRIIVFRGVPIMAMARLPTLESDGKANLKQGAIGAGIDMETGEIFHAEWKQHPLQMHPDTKNQIIGKKIPQWKQILAVACLAQKSSGLGYAGVDIVLGEKGGKTDIFVLEINKRPGLEIQNINQTSLLKRMDFIEEINLDFTEKSPLSSAEMGINLGKIWKTDNWHLEITSIIERKELDDNED